MLAIVKNAPPTLPVEAIEVGKRSRGLNPITVEKIRASVEEIGLLYPVLVWRDETAIRLCAGLHRLEACKALGWKDIPIRMVTADSPAEAIIAEIDENLARGELSYAERSLAVAMREVAFLRLHEVKDLGELQRKQAGPKGGRPPKKPDCQPDSPVTTKKKSAKEDAAPSFVADTVENTGLSERTVHRLKEVGAIENLKDVVGTEADKPLVLYDLAAIDKTDKAKAQELIAAVKDAEAEKDEAAKTAEAATKGREEADRKAKDEAEKAEAASRAREKAEQDAAALKVQEDQEKAKQKEDEAKRLKAEEEKRKADAEHAKAEADKKAEEEQKAKDEAAKKAEGPKEAAKKIRATATEVKTEKKAESVKDESAKVTEDTDAYLKECIADLNMAIELLKFRVRKGELKSLRKPIKLLKAKLEEASD